MDEEFQKNDFICSADKITCSPDRPLSPILNSCKLTKKSAIRRRSSKSRTVKVNSEVTDNTEKDIDLQTNFNLSERPDISTFNELDDDRYDRLIKLKEIEAQRSKVCNMFYNANEKENERPCTSSDNSEFQFKVPMSLVRKRRKNRGKENVIIDSHVEGGDFTPYSPVENSSFSFPANNSLGTCGFITAAGKPMKLPPNFNEIKQKLIEDDYFDKASTSKDSDHVSLKNLDKKLKQRQRRKSPRKRSYESYLYDPIGSDYAFNPQDCNSSCLETGFSSYGTVPSSENVYGTNVPPDALIDEFSHHLQMEIDNLGEDDNFKDPFVSEAKKFTKQLEDSENKSIASDFVDTEYQNYTKSSDDDNTATVKEIFTELLQNNDKSENDLSSVTDFYGFDKSECIDSNKVLDLCNNVIDMMNEQISLIASKAQSVSSGSFIDENTAEEADKIFQVKNLKKLVQYCKNKVINLNCSEDNSDESVKISKRPPSKQTSSNAKKKIKIKHNQSSDLNPGRNFISKAKSKQMNSFLDKIDEVNESSSSSSHTTVSEKINTDLSKKSENFNDAQNTQNILEPDSLNISNSEGTLKVMELNSGPDKTEDILNSDIQLFSGFNNSIKIFDELHKIVENLGKVSNDITHRCIIESVECQTSGTNCDVKSVQVDSEMNLKKSKTEPINAVTTKDVASKIFPNRGISISEDAIKKVKALLKKTILEGPRRILEQNDEPVLETAEQTSGSGDKGKIEESLREGLEQFKAGIEKSKKLYKEITETNLKDEISINDNKKGFCSFKTASNKALFISESSLSKSKNIMKDTCEDVHESVLKENGKASNANVYFLHENVKFKMNDVSNSSVINNDKHQSTELYTKSSINTNTSTKAQNKSESTLNSTDALAQRSNVSMGFKKASGNVIAIDEKALLKSKDLFKDIDENKESVPVDGEKAKGQSYLEAKIKLEQIFTPPKTVEISPDNPRPTSAKKRLGVKSCKQIFIPEHKVEKMKQIFENLQDAKSEPQTKPEQVKIQDNIEKNERLVSTSTPVKSSITFRGHLLSPYTEKLSPIKKTANSIVSNENLVIPGKSLLFWKRENESENADSFVAKLNDEIKMQEQRTKLLNEKLEIIRRQINLLDDENNENRRPKLGVLTRKKRESNRYSLKQTLNSYPVQFSENVIDELFNITPKNAALVHFYVPWKDSEKIVSFLPTSDNSVVVANVKDYVGLPEIKFSFEMTPGVDPRLIPSGWISNHYRWIVWKLASYERKYNKVFGSCLIIDNIMQQLKYRYDREIDKNERPCLRKILEKDDTSVKRMVLLVSDIIKVAYNKHELELSDGWYSVRTIIDSPLNSLILKKKILVGNKIITYCAELLNCEGCHPLQQTEQVKLKISYNCTRPAHWYSKLGFQKYCLPFPIPLSSVQIEGGIIGCTKLLVIRIYPVRYMEKNPDSTTVWRNKKAEEKYASEWERKFTTNCENIGYKVQKEFEKELTEARKKTALHNFSVSEISNINCPKIIFDLVENTTDPDMFKEILSVQQQKLFLDYQQRIQSERQQELQNRIKKELEKIKCVKRDVVQVWKLVVVDAYSEKSEKYHTFTIWKPSDEHMQIIKEGCTMFVYNLLPKKHGDLTSNCRTKFHLTSSNNSQRFEQVQRRILPIPSISHTTGKLLLNEFDTVGTIVRLKVSNDEQEIWLTDCNLRLLFIKIMEGPKLCCLLDGLSIGQNIVLCNLVAFGVQDKVAQAIGNQYTVISTNPQQIYLREALKKHIEQITDANVLVKEADIKIEECIIKSDFFQNNTFSKPLYSSISINASELFDESSDDNGIIPSELTKTDVAMSLINTEQFF